MDKREKRAVNDMATALKRLVEVLERHPHDTHGQQTLTNKHRADAMVHAVGLGILAVKRIQRKEDEHGARS